MSDDPADRRSAPRFAATFRIRLGYPDISAFLDGYAVNISKGGIYVPTKQPREKGTEVRFELLLKDGSAAVCGAGRVAWSKAFDPAKPGERYGMGVQFVSLEGASEDIVKRAMAWREKHGQADKEVTDEGGKPEAAPKAEPKPEPEAVAKPEAKPEPKSEPEAKPEPEAAPAADAKAGLARKVLGKQKVTMGNVDDLLASLRGKQGAKRPAIPPQPEPEPPAAEALPPRDAPGPAGTTSEPTAMEPERTAGESPAPVHDGEREPEAAAEAADPNDGVSAYAIAGVESPATPPASEPPAAPEPEAPKAATPKAAKTDDGMPSLEDLEAALATVSVPPPPPKSSVPPADPMLDIDVGAPAVAARGAGHAGAHDPDGLELPGWDDEPAAPTLSSQLGQAELGSALADEEGQSEILEAADDLDIDSLPRYTGEMRIPEEARPPGELFQDIPGAAPAEPPPPAHPSEPELPVVGGMVPEKLEGAVRQKLATAPARAGNGPEDADGETAVMTRGEQVMLDQLMKSQVPSRPSVADLPPPPDMPAPIPGAPADERKSGFFGKLFGRKKK
jgi:uncharacterized protein (TIGR02266 family)